MPWPGKISLFDLSLALCHPAWGSVLSHMSNVDIVHNLNIMSLLLNPEAGQKLTSMTSLV